jgi:immunity protein 35 of polymorphic toxin system
MGPDVVRRIQSVAPFRRTSEDLPMVTKSEAEAIVREWLDKNKIQSWHQGTLVEEIELAIARMDEHPWGWMIFWNAKKCLESRDFGYALGGNCPIYVTRHDGVLHEAVAGSGVPIEEHLKIFTSRLAKDR